jgi:hypothetical protein
MATLDICQVDKSINGIYSPFLSKRLYSSPLRSGNIQSPTSVESLICDGFTVSSAALVQLESSNREPESLKVEKDWIGVGLRCVLVHRAHQQDIGRFASGVPSS